MRTVCMKHETAEAQRSLQRHSGNTPGTVGRASTLELARGQDGVGLRVGRGFDAAWTAAAGSLGQAWLAGGASTHQERSIRCVLEGARGHGALAPE